MLPAKLAERLAPMWRGGQPLRAIYRPADQTRPQRQHLAEGYEYTTELRAQVGDQAVVWTERRLVVRSLKLAAAQDRALRQRVATAQQAIATLTVRHQGKKRFTQAADLRAAAEQLVATHRVTGLLILAVETHTTKRPLRSYGARPAGVQSEPTLTIHVWVNATALATALRSLGWRVYATNQPARQLSLPQAVLAYRAEYLVEHGFGRLTGKPLALTPLYLDSDERVTGLIRLLTMGLRVLTLLEFGARRQLHAQGQKLAGLYAGNPTRATARPTTELMLRAFEGLTLTRLRAGDGDHVYLTPLTPVQQRILDLLDLSPTIYWRVAQHCSEPLRQMSEP